ncbi:hypothetical protein D3C80_1499070 [compost metagenome]
MNRLYGRSDSEPGGGTTPSPIFDRMAKFSSARATSHPASNRAKDFALSATTIFSQPRASATSVAPARRLCTAR